jgi:tetratricopeptide (TPR) repeat protein
VLCIALSQEIKEAAMNVRLIVIFALLFSSYARCQQMSSSGSEIGQTVNPNADAGSAFKKQLMRRIALEEAAVQRAESAAAGKVELSRVYVQLGLSYQDAAQWDRAETALKRAVFLARTPPVPSANLAAALSQLGSLHILMGKLRESEKEAREALELREGVGDRLQIARSQNNLAILFLTQKKFERARDSARQAEAEFDTNEKSEPVDRLTARFTLAQAFCHLKDCLAAIPVLKAALDDAKATLRPDDFPVGLSTFLLGYVYWKSGDMSEAAGYLEKGTTLMSTQLGWGHPAYLKVLRCYAQFLHENRQVEAADVVERRIRQSEAVVDVHSIQTTQGMFGFDGQR